jgi:hypothetical protein
MSRRSVLRPEPSIQYEICHNLPTVDLLVSLAYSAAAGGVLEDPLPVNLGLRVKPPKSSGTRMLGADGLCDFDTLDIAGVTVFFFLLQTHTHPRTGIGQKRVAIAELIDSLPAVGCVVTLVDSRSLFICRSRT